MAGATTDRLASVVRSAGNISTLPQIAVKIMQLTASSDTPIDELEEAIAGDPAMTTRVLRTVNSSAFALRERISTLHQAISYLGFQAIRSLTVALSVSKVFKDGEQIGKYDRVGLWRHLVSVGLCARLVADHCRINSREDVYLAGLLHDIGYILADEHDHRYFVKYIASLEEGDIAPDQERKVMGYDHTQLGSRVAKEWRLPDFICTAIRFHHASQACRGEYAKVAQCVEVADFLCTFKGITALGTSLSKPAPQVLQALDLSRDDLSTLLDKLKDQIADNNLLFEM